MASRAEDWFKQGQRDVDHARRAREDRDYEWACFAAQQGAEKAVKAVFQTFGGVAWGHSVTALLDALPDESGPVAPELIDAAKELDKHYIPARYPNSHPQGAPFEFYTQGEADRAIGHADAIITFCAGFLSVAAAGDREAEKGDDPPHGDAPRN